MNDKIKISSFDEFEEQHGGDILNDEIIEIEVPKIGITWGELKDKVFPKSERVIFGLGRGQVGMINATTNIGKTTFALNLALSLATGATFLPFTEGQTKALRIMIIDGENTQAELRYDLNTMMRDWSPIQQRVIDENLLIICDEYIKDEPLNLVDRTHLEAVVERAIDFKPDLIIVDTMAALFALRNENDNAEVKRFVMTPLKTLGKEANSAILLLHHIGKTSEDSFATNAAYSGRGGSNFGALSRTVIKFSNPDKADKSRVVFSVAKSKGYRQEDLLMKLDYDSRWFSISNEPPPKPVTSYEEVVKFINKELSTKAIVEHFEGKYSKRTVEQNLKQAVDYGDILKLQQGRYEPIDSAKSAEPISDSGNSGNANKLDDIEKLEEKYNF